MGEQKCFVPCLLVWDIENIAVPKKGTVHHFLSTIRRLVLNDNNLREEDAFCSLNDKNQRFSQNFLQKIRDENVDILSCNNGIKNAADSILIKRIERFLDVRKNGIAVTLITDDKDFIQTVVKVRRTSNRVFLVCSFQGGLELRNAVDKYYVIGRDLLLAPSANFFWDTRCRAVRPPRKDTKVFMENIMKAKIREFGLDTYQTFVLACGTQVDKGKFIQQYSFSPVVFFDYQTFHDETAEELVTLAKKGASHIFLYTTDWELIKKIHSLNLKEYGTKFFYNLKATINARHSDLSSSNNSSITFASKENTSKLNLPNNIPSRNQSSRPVFRSEYRLPSTYRISMPSHNRVEIFPPLHLRRSEITRPPRHHFRRSERTRPPRHYSHKESESESESENNNEESCSCCILC